MSPNTGPCGVFFDGPAERWERLTQDEGPPSRQFTGPGVESRAVVPTGRAHTGCGKASRAVVGSDDGRHISDYKAGAVSRIAPLA